MCKLGPNCDNAEGWRRQKAISNLICRQTISICQHCYWSGPRNSSAQTPKKPIPTFAHPQVDSVLFCALFIGRFPTKTESILICAILYAVISRPAKDEIAVFNSWFGSCWKTNWRSLFHRPESAICLDNLENWRSWNTAASNREETLFSWK